MALWESVRDRCSSEWGPEKMPYGMVEFADEGSERLSAQFRPADAVSFAELHLCHFRADFEELTPAEPPLGRAFLATRPSQR
jgi:hypothetical protein